jgi:hypothetical protein
MKYLILLILLTGCSHQQPSLIMKIDDVSVESYHGVSKMISCEKVEKDAEERKECE